MSLLSLGLLPLRLAGGILCLLVSMEKNFTLCGTETKLYMHPTFDSYTHGLVTIKCDQDFNTSDKVMDYAGIVCSKDANLQHLYDMFPYHYLMYCMEDIRCYYFSNTDEGEPVECALDCRFLKRIPLT
ncbi:hypothetical protein XENTR_v10023509 [Xenopus tropicalis]|nr:hypothetical protein XENTR_v10023509 [Xenopus tropicalis]